MLKISLMDQSDLEFAYEIEKEVNPTPWSKKNFFSSFEVGHNSIVCKHENNLIGFAIFSLVREECHLLNIAVTKSWHRKGCLLYTSPSPRDRSLSRMPSSA